MTKIPTIEEMLKAGMHFGHRTSKWHPKMGPFIFGARNGVHIIDLIKSRKKFEEALDYIKKSVSENKVILFVGTKTQAKKTIKRVGQETGMPFVSEKWLGGLLTNFAIIKKLIKKYNDLTAKKKEGKLDKYTKKEQLDFDREINRLDLRVGGMADMIKIPDILFIWDIKKEKTAVLEAKKKDITIIAVCDTNVNPKNIDYIIPSNDDATKTIKLVLNTVKEAIEEAKKAKNQ